MALIQVDFISKSLMRTVTINAIVPIDKLSLPGMPVREKKPFKTLYLLHGIFGNYTDWVTGTRIQRWAEENNLVVIMPSGENHFYVDNEKANQMYGQFIGKELVQVTRDLFPLSDKREDTFIAGLSMGGYGAIRNGLKYAETFGYVAGLSSGFIFDNIKNSTYEDKSPTGNRGYYEYVFGDLDQLEGSDKDVKALITQLINENRELPKLYLACGTEDFLYEANIDYKNFLEQNHVDFTYEEGPGAHTWDFWDTYIYKVLQWLPLEDKSSGINSGNVK